MQIIASPCIRRLCTKSIHLPSSVSIGDISIATLVPKRPHLIPSNVNVCGIPLAESEPLPQDILRHLRWIMQKDNLHQDVFLLGAPGLLRRSLAMKYCEMTYREVEYIAISRDTTESDLKQRREIKDGTAFYIDQGAVRAALHGRVLILDSIEKAERNVLPALNNLLENREMSLDDGRFLVAPSRYDALLAKHSQQQLDDWKLCRVSERFFVIALGLPTPHFAGAPLDPPLRSRFQGRDVRPLQFSSQIQCLQKYLGDAVEVEGLVSFAHTLLEQSNPSLSRLPAYPSDSLKYAGLLMSHFPGLSSITAIHSIFPFTLLADKTSHSLISEVLTGLRLSPPLEFGKGSPQFPFVLKNVEKQGIDLSATLFFSYDHRRNNIIKIDNVPIGSEGDITSNRKIFIESPEHSKALAGLAASHAIGADICLVGPRGSGKTAVVNEFARRFSYRVEPISLFEDMTARELLQQRGTESNGDTIWRPSPLVTAALEGSLCVLDGLEHLDKGTLSLLQSLLHQRELSLFDGTRLLSVSAYSRIREDFELSDDDMTARGILCIHPSFRVLAVATPPLSTDSTQSANTQSTWLTSEAATMFQFHCLNKPSRHLESLILERLVPGKRNVDREALLRFSRILSSGSDDCDANVLHSLASLYSMRQLLRICRRLESHPEDSLYAAVHKAALSRFLPQTTRETLDRLLEEADIMPPPTLGISEANVNIDTISKPGYVSIGSVTAPIAESSPEHDALVPDVLFYDNPRHTLALQEMAKDFLLGEHLLLVGNQGVAKNKLADRFLSLLNLPREYIQLHRDTTIQSLTLQPSVCDGVLVYEDSALVKAAIHGRVLVIDEADKAPTTVTSILKTLTESGEMMLSDGRRLVSGVEAIHAAEHGHVGVIPVHKDFRMIVLANRPGFPFLGNDFYGSIGDHFSCHAIDNPDLLSEVSILRRYGPDVPERILSSLVQAIDELRINVTDGRLTYPYSTRELVSIVRHLQSYPEQGVASALGNVFDFDAYDADVRDMLAETFRRHGVPLGASLHDINLSKEEPLPEPTLLESWRPSTKVSLTDTLKCYRGTLRLSNQRDLDCLTPHLLNPVDRHETRSHEFSELLHRLTLPLLDPTSGHTIDVSASPATASFSVLGVNPLCLYNVTPDHRTFSVVDLRGKFPMTPRVSNVNTSAHGSHDSITMAHLGGRLSGNLILQQPFRNRILLVDTLSSGNDNGMTYRELELPAALFGEGFVHRISYSFGFDRADVSEKDMFWMDSTLSAQNQLVFFNRGQSAGTPSDQDSTPSSSTVAFVDVNTESVNWIQLPGDITDVVVWDEHVLLARFAYSGCDVAVIRSTPHSDRDYGNLWDSSEKSVEWIKGDAILRNIGGTNFMAKPLLDPEFASRFYDNITETSIDTASSTHPLTCRLLGTPHNRAVVVSGDLNSTSSLELSAPIANIFSLGNVSNALPSLPLHLNESHQTVRVVEMGKKSDDFLAKLELIDLQRLSRKVFSIPKISTNKHRDIDNSRKGSGKSNFVRFGSLYDGSLVTLGPKGDICVYETNHGRLDTALSRWRSMVGEEVSTKPLQVTYQRDSGKDVSFPKHGKVDDKNEPHVGGNTWAGGTGGRDTAGLGGKGGPYRLDAGHDVHQISQEEKDAVPDHVKKAAREMGVKAFKERLKEIGMSEYDSKVYHKFLDKVYSHVKTLRNMLGSQQSKGQERVWLRNQTQGDLDDGKLIEGITGERAIYRRRGDKKPEVSGQQQLVKRLRFVLDCSGSMYRFNGFDGRLERMMEAACMIMESLDSFTQKYSYSIMGHSGESPCIRLVEESDPPKNEMERLKVLQTMHAHAQFCMSGDHTLEAVEYAIRDIVREPADDYFVVVLSDANLDRYGIRPSRFGAALLADSRVNASALFIGSLGSQAETLRLELPPGHGFVCMDTEHIPQAIGSIFTAAMVRP